MVKRITASVLWFIATSMAYSLIAYFVALPESAWAAVGATAAVLVGLDPGRRLWATSEA